MPIPLHSPEVLNREFLEIRARLLHVAASLDRIDRAEGSVAGDARMDMIRKSLTILSAPAADRAEKIQLLFSRPYDAHWKSNLLKANSKA
ncbi:MAG: hypothetical protein WDZ48_10120 [Pirellulales bacterium]